MTILNINFAPRRSYSSVPLLCRLPLTLSYLGNTDCTSFSTISRHVALHVRHPPRIMIEVLSFSSIYDAFLYLIIFIFRTISKVTEFLNKFSFTLVPQAYHVTFLNIINDVIVIVSILTAYHITLCSVPFQFQSSTSFTKFRCISLFPRNLEFITHARKCKSSRTVSVPLFSFVTDD